MDWQLTVLQPEMHPVFWNLIRTPSRSATWPRSATGRRGWRAPGPILDDHLGGRRHFVAGDALTVGDIPVGCYYWRYVNLDIERPNLPNLQIWFQSLKERDAYRRHVMLPVT
jgi:glutathione S-transferase